MPKLHASVERVTYRGERDGYAVLKVKPTQDSQEKLFDRELDRDNLITVVGSMPNLEVGDKVEFSGEWGSHPKHGENFQVESYKVETPTTLDGLEKFLASDHIKGVGEVFAERITRKFKDETARVLTEEPEKLTQVKGITKTKARKIADQWKKANDAREQTIALQGMGATPNLAAKIIDVYGEKAAQKVKENPYRLSSDIWGVGFKRADELAGGIGIHQADPRRVQAGIRYALRQALENGHLYLPQAELTEETARLIQVNTEDVREQIGAMIDSRQLVREDSAVYLKTYHRSESNLADQIGRMKKQYLHSSRLKAFWEGDMDLDWEKTFAWVAKKQGFKLNNGQQQAVQTALTTPVAVLTGGPGTGKSTAVNAIVEILKSKDKKLVLASPTGRAAKRLTELTGQEASTIHRLLKLQPGGTAEYNRENPLPVDMVVVDEASMLDVLLSEKFFDAIKPGTHVLLVGDADQLPSVSAGNVLRDIIGSNTVPVVKLTEIFRQAKESAIVRNAHRLNRGQKLEFPNHPTDFYLFPEKTPEDTGARIIELVSERIPGQFGFDPLEEIQVLSPMYKTAAGVSRLNNDLQRVLNPPHRRAGPKGQTRFREGDRVLQLSNNYEKEVFNGEIGRVKGVGKDKLEVAFDDTNVTYETNELDQLTLAYAISVHKAQGSEYPVVVMPVTTAHYIMLQRNLLYTGITRAKKLVVLVGSKKALYIALKNDKPRQRYSRLKERLRQEV